MWIHLRRSILRQGWRPLQARRYLANYENSSRENATRKSQGDGLYRNWENEQEQHLALQVSSEIRKSLAEDAEDGAATFYRRDGKLSEISGARMDQEWQPDPQDEALVLEMVDLFKQGNVAAWEAEDIVRNNGGRLLPWHVFEVLKACRVDPILALAFFKWAGLQANFQHGQETFNMMLKLLEEEGKCVEMAQLSREMGRLNVPKSAITFRILMNAFFQGGLLEEALETFSQMENSSTPPDVWEYGRMIKAMMAAEYYPVIPVLYDRLLAAGWLPDAHIYNAVISSYCNMAKMDEAVTLFEKMKTKCSCDIFTYTILIDGFIKCYKVGRATDFFMEMLERGCLPGEEIFNLLFGLLARTGKFEQAVDLFRKIIENGCQPTLKSYGMLLDAFSMADNLQGAYEFFKELVDKGHHPSIVTCNTLLGRLKKAGKTWLALKFFEDMKAFSGSKPSTVTYNIAIDLLGKLGRFQEAWNTFEEMKASGCVPCLMTYNNLIIRLGRAGSIETCFNLFEEMKVRGIDPNLYTYCAMIDVLTRYNQLEQALQFLDEMKKRNFSPLPMTLQILVKCLWTSGNMPAARKLCEEYPGIYTLENQPLALSSLSRVDTPAYSSTI